jgi:hypothetical protein
MSSPFILLVCSQGSLAIVIEWQSIAIYYRLLCGRSDCGFFDKSCSLTSTFIGSNSELQSFFADIHCEELTTAMM